MKQRFLFDRLLAWRTCTQERNSSPEKHLTDNKGSQAQPLVYHVHATPDVPGTEPTDPAHPSVISPRVHRNKADAVQGLLDDPDGF